MINLSSIRVIKRGYHLHGQADFEAGMKPKWGGGWCRGIKDKENLLHCHSLPIQKLHNKDMFCFNMHVCIQIWRFSTHFRLLFELFEPPNHTLQSMTYFTSLGLGRSWFPHFVLQYWSKSLMQWWNQGWSNSDKKKFHCFSFYPIQNFKKGCFPHFLPL